MSLAPARSAAVLVALMAAGMPCAAAPQWLETHGASLRYELSGEGGEVIVLLHEIGSTLETWDEVMPALRRHGQVLRYDLRGFGLSEKIRGPYSMDDAVAELHGLLDGLQLRQRVSLVGAAIGGTIALKFAARYPERVRSLVLVSPIFTVAGIRAAVVAPAGGPASTPLAVTTPPSGPRGPDTATLIETQGVRAYLAAQSDNLYPSRLRTDPARLVRYHGMQLSSDPDSRAAMVRLAAQSGNVAEELAKIRAPTLVVATSLFQLRPAAAVKPIADAIPGASFVDLPTGHLAALESPELLAPALHKFFSSLTRNRN